MRRAGLAALMVLLIAAPFISGGTVQRLLTLLFAFAAMASAWNIVAGLAGYVDLGMVAFFGLGGYSTGLLVARAGLPFPVAWLAGGLLSVAFAVCLGLLLRRFPRQYFAVATLAASLALRDVASHWVALTGGSAGLSLPPQTLPDKAVYMIMLGLLALVLALARSIGASRPELIPAYAAEGLYTGLVGGAYACWVSFIDPATMFDAGVTVEVVAMAVLGGLGTVSGPLAGAIVLGALSEVLNSYAPGVHVTVLGLIIVGVLLLAPGGLAAAVRAARGLFSVMVTFTRR